MEKYYITTREYVKEIDATNRYNAYGNFLDRFNYCADYETKKKLIESRPENDEKYPIDMAKIAATVEILAKANNLPIPEWVYDKKYYLETPYYGKAKRKEYRELLRNTSPLEFKKRNIFWVTM